MITIYHNPRCSKSRECKSFLSTTGKEVQVINYMETPFTTNKLTEVIGFLGIEPIELVRTNEQIWKDLYKGKELSRENVIKAMIEHPKLIQRPIVINDGKAVIARPLHLINSVI
jgi:arsenate reductase